MSNPNPTAIPMTDSSNFLALIKGAVSHQIQVTEAAIKADSDFIPTQNEDPIVASFGEEIKLTLDIGTQISTPVRIGVKSIRGFWSDSVVTGGLSTSRIHNSGRGSYSASISSSSGGLQDDGLTEAEAYINKGKAIQIVAETLAMAEKDGELAGQLDVFFRLMDTVVQINAKRRDQKRADEQAAIQAKLENDPDLIPVNDVESLVEALKGITMNSETGKKVMLTFRGSQPTLREGDEALKSVVAFNTRTQKRNMTSQFIGDFKVAERLEHLPSTAGSGRHFERIALKDLPLYLETESKGPIFISRKHTTLALIETIAGQ